jgi:hypothetical protein
MAYYTFYVREIGRSIGRPTWSKINQKCKMYNVDSKCFLSFKIDFLKLVENVLQLNTQSMRF